MGGVAQLLQVGLAGELDHRRRTAHQDLHRFQGEGGGGTRRKMMVVVVVVCVGGVGGRWRWCGGGGGGEDGCGCEGAVGLGQGWDGMGVAMGLEMGLGCFWRTTRAFFFFECGRPLIVCCPPGCLRRAAVASR